MTTQVKVAPQGDREILITRSFNAPRALVFDAMSKPEMLKRWFSGPPGWTLSTCDIDLRVGGSHRRVWTNEAGQEMMGMGGVYTEVVRPSRIVGTQKFDQAMVPGEAVVTFEFTEAKDITLMAMTIAYESKETRDGMLTPQMESGLNAGYDRLDQLLKTA
ncbi:MAG: SRPBCC family protein [Flavobacteriales bacterium]